MKKRILVTSLATILLCSLSIEAFQSEALSDFDNQPISETIELSDYDAEVVLENPDITFALISSQFADALRDAESLFKNEDRNEAVQQLYFYLHHGYKVAPQSAIQETISKAFLLQNKFIEKQHVEPQSILARESRSFRNEPSFLNDLPMILQGPSDIADFDYELACFKGSRGKKGKHGSRGAAGPAGPAGPTGPAGTFSGTVLDTQFSIVDATDQTKKLQFDVQGTSGTTTTIITDPTVNRSFTTPDIDGTALVSQTGTGIVFIGVRQRPWTDRMRESNTVTRRPTAAKLE